MKQEAIFVPIMVAMLLIVSVRVIRHPEKRKRIEDLFLNHKVSSLLMVGAMLVAVIGIRVSPLWKQERWKRAWAAAINAFIIAMFAAVDSVFAPFWFALTIVYFTGEL
jgi:hypothetical protein